LAKLPVYKILATVSRRAAQTRVVEAGRAPVATQSSSPHGVGLAAGDDSDLKRRVVLQLFPVTRQSLVLQSRSPDERVRSRAFAALTAAYWRPVYKYLRVKWRASVEDAQDLAQSFFLADSTRRLMTTYDARRARFRTYLRTCLDGFVANERKSAGRLKRGGDAQVVSLELKTAEAELGPQEFQAGSDLEALFYREWVRSLFGLAVDAFRDRARAEGKDLPFVLFERYDLAEQSSPEKPTYADLADQFGIPVTQVTNHLAFARRQFREIVLEKLAQLCSSEEEFREEARDLLGIDPQ
jgi:DNA-directed RNA polymerase specialized sigma24 family protein